MNIIFLYTGSNGFPLGDAYTNRVLSLAKGLMANACNVKILILYPGREIGVPGKRGIYEDIPYEYRCIFKTAKHKWRKKLRGGIGIILSSSSILFQNRNTDVVISFSESFYQNFFLSLAAKLKNIIFLREVNEYPRAVLNKNSTDIGYFTKLRIRLGTRGIDGFIMINKGLKNFFSSSLNIKKPVLIIPIVVEKERFRRIPENEIRDFITYCGNLDGAKDGIDILIRSFSKIAASYPSLKLRLIGAFKDSAQHHIITGIIEDLNIQDKVEITGFINREELPALLSESRILALARPDNTQAKGGFPTKLGEYLATARPVIVTAVGDIPDYIVDGENAHLATPGDADSFSSKIDLVLSDYDKALKIAGKGYGLVETQFNPGFQGKRIMSFIKSLRGGS